MITRNGKSLQLKSVNTSLNISEVCKGKTQPLYLYDLDSILKRYELMKSSLGGKYKIHYALKANHNPLVISNLANKGAAVDVVSIGEMNWALENGFKSEDVVFSGVAKTKAEIQEALEKGVGQINIESEAEFERILNIAKKLGVKAPVSFRVNPDVEAETHPYIRTGMKENKFGVEFNVVDKLVKKHQEWSGHITLKGLSLHIGSQIRDAKPFAESIRKSLSRYLEWKKIYPEMSSIDIGGGVGIDYKETNDAKDIELWDQYVEQVKALLDPILESGELKEVILEPGRFLVGRYGFLLSQVQYIKKTPFKKFVILNTGMHHLMRPSLYQAFHRIEMVLDRSENLTVYDVVGPICESSDVVGHDRMLPDDIQEEDWTLIADAGAYGQVMSNSYNMHPPADEVVLFNGELHG